MEAFFADMLRWAQSIWDFVLSGIYDFTIEAFVLATKMAIYAWFEVQLFLLQVAYSTFKDIMADLGISQFIRNLYGDIPSDMRSGLAFFGIPEAVNMIISAIGTRLIMKFVPIIGR